MLGQFFEELKRRNVFRVAVAYVIASWLVLQVADIVLQGIEAPAWVMKVFMLVLALGLPFVLLFSWAYELTPEGLKKEKDVDRTESITPETGRKLNIITIGMVVAVLAVVVIERTVMRPEPAPVTTAPVTAAAEKSIAVLAFEDLSPEGDQEYFADGLSEELLNVLAKVSELKVAGRTSSFAFKGTTKDLREIGELLNVAHILEGSVRKAGNRIRVTAQLIKADDGFHLFSETYDRDLEDIFAVQDEIAAEISNALLTEIVGTEAIVKTQTDTEAFELFLMARQRIHSRDILNLREADVMLDRVLEIDPEYAPAHAQKALVTHLMSDSLGAYGDIPVAQTRPISQHHIDRALELDDQLAEAYAVQGLLLDDMDRIDEAITVLEKARELNPTLSDAANWLSTSLGGVGRWDDGRRVLEEVVKRDPTYGPAFNNLVAEYTRTSQIDQAEALTARVARIVGENDDVRMAQGITAFMKGDIASAARYFKRSLELNPSSTVLRMWHGFALLGLADFEQLAFVGLDEHRILAFGEQNYAEEALQILAEFDLDAAFAPRALEEIGLGLVLLGEDEAYLEFVEEHYGSVAGLLDAQPITQAWTTGYAGLMAWLCRERGDAESANLLLAAMKEKIESQPEMAGNMFHNYSVAEYAALTGDKDAALQALRDAFDNGLMFITGFASPVFSDIAGDPAFVAVQGEMRGRTDEQRAILGMPPYRPVRPTEERPTFVN